MTILLMEHLTSVPGAECPAGLIGEGRAMRDALLADLLALRGVRIVLLRRREHAVPAHPRLRQVDPGGRRAARLRALAREVDAVLLIAPEGGGLLARLCRVVERAGRLLLGPSSSAVRLAADKWRLDRILRAAGIPTPRTVLLRRTGAAAALRRRERPFVLKPRDGFGSLGVTIIGRGDPIGPALESVRSATGRSDLLAQDFIEGDAASVSVLAGEGLDGTSAGIVPLGLNRQRIAGGRRPVYLGGESGWRHPMEEAAEGIARDALRALVRAAPGCRGYLGVDLILGPAGPVVLEINPRITTSYLGLRRVLRPNLAGLLRAAVLGASLPRMVRIDGRCRYDTAGRTIRMRTARWRGGLPRADGIRACRNTSAGTSAASI